MVPWAVLTTLSMWPITARIPDWRGRKLYDPAVSSGKILIAVTDPPENALEEIGKRLGAAGAEVAKEFRN